MHIEIKWKLRKKKDSIKTNRKKIQPKNSVEKITLLKT